MHKIFNDIWKVYPENMLKNRTWHWWWWLHFFENPDNPEFPKQLMVLWGTRNCKKVRVDDFYWEPRIPMETMEDLPRKHAQEPHLALVVVAPFFRKPRQPRIP